MITGELKSKVDSIWNTMWSGGISNPLSVIEQLTYLLFIKRLDELHTLKEAKAARTGKPIGDPVFTAKQDKLRWSRFKEAAPEQMFELVFALEDLIDWAVRDSRPVNEGSFIDRVSSSMASYNDATTRSNASRSLMSRRTHGSRGEDLLALLAQLALRPDVPVERHGIDPEFAAERGHGGVAVRHRGLASRTWAFDSANVLPPLRPRARAAVSPARVVRFYNTRGTAEQWIKEGKQATHWTRLSCHRFRANEVRLQLSVLAYTLGNLWRRLVLPPRIKRWSLTSLQQRLVKTGGRLVKHARYYWLLLAEGHLTRRLFGDMLRRIWALPVPAG